MNETFFHWEAIMIPKSLSCKGLEYRMRVAFAFFIFASHQSMKQYDQRVLVKNKNTGTLVATTSEKLPRVQQFFTDIWVELFPSDTFMRSKTTHWRAKVQKHCQLRGDHLRKKADELSSNPLNACQGSSSRHLGQMRNAQIDGQYCGVQLAAPPDCPRPVPPFPFMAVNMLTAQTSKDLTRIYAITKALKERKPRAPEKYVSASGEVLDRSIEFASGGGQGLAERNVSSLCDWCGCTIVAEVSACSFGDCDKKVCAECIDDASIDKWISYEGLYYCSDDCKSASMD